MRRILFVDDEAKILDGFRRLLHRERGEWEVLLANSGAAALEEMARAPVDVVLSDMRMPGMDGAALLEQVALRYPDTIRIVLSGQTDAEAARRALPVAHQFLTKPCQVTEVREVVNRAFALRDALRSPGLRRIVGNMDGLPTVPAVWLAMRRILASTGASVDQIAALIEQDAGLSAKMLQLVNSSFFGHGRQVTGIAQATILLGTGVIRSLATAEQLFSAAFTARQPGCTLEREQAHGIAVGRLAQRIVADPALSEAAFSAGLLHDLGKLILASRLPQTFADDLAEAARRGVPLHRVEHERAGVSHAEVGAYLLSLWGLPRSITEAVAYHHTPSAAEPGDQRVLLAVHLADALTHGGTEGPEAEAMRLDPVAVGDAGSPEALDHWRDLAGTLAEEA